MIKRELYMKRIRPFIGTDLIKVMTGMRPLVNRSCWSS